jgi:hypothetical protein
MMIKNLINYFKYFLPSKVNIVDVVVDTGNGRTSDN